MTEDRPGPYVPRRKGAWTRPLPLSMPLMLRGAYRPEMAENRRDHRPASRKPKRRAAR